MRIFELLNDETYNWKDVSIELHAGDTFYGGHLGPFPAARQYSVTYNHKRIWFTKTEVENHPSRFRELFK